MSARIEQAQPGRSFRLKRSMGRNDAIQLRFFRECVFPPMGIRERTSFDVSKLDPGKRFVILRAAGSVPRPELKLTPQEFERAFEAGTGAAAPAIGQVIVKGVVVGVGRTFRTKRTLNQSRFRTLKWHKEAKNFRHDMPKGTEFRIVKVAYGNEKKIKIEALGAFIGAIIRLTYEEFVKIFIDENNESAPQISDSALSAKKEIWKKFLATAEAEKGVTASNGNKRHDDRILEYHSTTNATKSVETPWCASFVNWVVNKSGSIGNGNASAKSWTTWGVELKKGEPGCVVVIYSASAAGTTGTGNHVGFFKSQEGSKMVIIGGNQEYPPGKYSVCNWTVDTNVWKVLAYRG